MTGVRTRRNANANSQAMWPEDVQSDLDADADVDGEGEGESELSGRETEDDDEGRENRAETATPTAASASGPRSSRIKHSVNLSMDSIYMALQAADADGDSSSGADLDQMPESAVDPHPPTLVITNSVPLPLSSQIPPPTSPSVLSPVPRSPQMDIEEELRRESEKNKGREKLSVDAETASLAASVSPVRRRVYTALADLAIPQLPQQSPSNSPQSSINASPRSSLLITTASMYARNATPSPSPNSAGAATPILPCASKSGLVRKNSLTANDSDWAGGSTSTQSTRPSPLTPDSPPLPTPAGDESSRHTSFASFTTSEVNGSYGAGLVRKGSTGKYQSLSPPPLSPSAPSMGIASSQDSSMSISTNQSLGFANASGSMFGRLNGFGPARPRSNSHAYAQVNGYTNENVQFIDIVEPESDTRTGWTDIRLPRNGIILADANADAKARPPQQQQHRTLQKPPPVSPPPRSANGPPSSPNTTTATASINSVKSNGSTEKRASADGNSPTGGGFFKSRIKPKKKSSQVPSLGDSPLATTFGFQSRAPSAIGSVDNGSVVSGWADARDIKKAAKAEEKKRKKAEEKAKLEALAAQFSQQRARAQSKDQASVVSSGSSERRRAANEWVEDSSGMYGAGGVQVWGGL